MSGTPTPRPALKKAADAHIHPAAPGHRTVLLRHPDAPTTTAPAPRAPTEDVPGDPSQGKGRAPSVAGKSSLLSGPLGGHTSDSIRRPKGRGSRRAADAGKKVELTVEIPKSLRKELNARLKTERTDADAVVAALLRGWLDG